MIRSGYTLVELMIVISIMGILVTMGASAYGGARRRQQAASAGEQIIQLINENQTQASIGKKDCEGKFTGLELRVGASTITSQSICEGGVGVARPTEIDGITFTTNPTITFLPLTKGMDLGGQSTIPLSYTPSGSNELYKITLTSSGNIQYEGIQ